MVDIRLDICSQKFAFSLFQKRKEKEKTKNYNIRATNNKELLCSEMLRIELVEAQLPVMCCNTFWLLFEQHPSSDSPAAYCQIFTVEMWPGLMSETVRTNICVAVGFCM